MNKKTVLNDELINRIKTLCFEYKTLKSYFPDAYQLMLIYNIKSHDAHSILDQLKGN